MVEDIGLIVTQVTNGVLSIVRILKRAYSQIWQSVEIQYLFEVADFIVRNVKFFKSYKSIETHPDALYPVASEI